MVADELDKITSVLENQEISVALLTSDEYLEAKKSLIEGKALGSDGFAPKVIRYCYLDDTILRDANKFLVTEKPDQSSESDMTVTDNYRRNSFVFNCSQISKPYDPQQNTTKN